MSYTLTLTHSFIHSQIHSLTRFLVVRLFVPFDTEIMRLLHVFSQKFQRRQPHSIEYFFIISSSVPFIMMLVDNFKWTPYLSPFIHSVTHTHSLQPISRSWLMMFFWNSFTNLQTYEYGKKNTENVHHYVQLSSCVWLVCLTKDMKNTHKLTHSLKSKNSIALVCEIVCHKNKYITNNFVFTWIKTPWSRKKTALNYSSLVEFYGQDFKPKQLIQWDVLIMLCQHKKHFFEFNSIHLKCFGINLRTKSFFYLVMQLFDWNNAFFSKKRSEKLEAWFSCEIAKIF